MKTTVLLLAATVASAGCSSAPKPVAVPAVANAASPAPGVVSAGRLASVDIPRLREAGIREVIDLTPDAETPDFDESAAVRAAGLRYSNLPLRGAVDLTRENVLAFDALLRASKRPLLVHCASSNRVGAMAALRAAWVDGRNVEDAIRIGKAWGLKCLESEVRRKLDGGSTTAP